MPLFTVILEHRGGTYISQVNARSVVAALRAWAQRGAALGIPRFGSRSASKALEDEVFLMAMPLDTLRNAWCTGLRFGGAFGLINVIATSTGPLTEGGGPRRSPGVPQSTPPPNNALQRTRFARR